MREEEKREREKGEGREKVMFLPTNKKEEKRPGRGNVRRNDAVLPF